MSTDLVVMLTNAPDTLLAKRIAHYLVVDALAACVNLGAQGLSMYMWQGVLEGTEEIPLTIKTTQARVPDVIEKIRELHPYQVPEVLVLPVIGGHEAYIDWVRAQTRPIDS